MPIKIPNQLPAKDVLVNENIFVMDENRALQQDIRAIRVAILNLMPTKITTTFTIVLLVAGALIAQYGLIGLIAKGYGTITWGFFAFYVVPICTIGVWKIMQEDKVLGNQK